MLRRTLAQAPREFHRYAEIGPAELGDNRGVDRNHLALDTEYRAAAAAGRGLGVVNHGGRGNLADDAAAGQWTDKPFARQAFGMRVAFMTGWLAITAEIVAARKTEAKAREDARPQLRFDMSAVQRPAAVP